MMEEPPHDPTVAMVRQHVYGPLRVWTTVLTALFRPYRRDGHPRVLWTD